MTTSAWVPPTLSAENTEALYLWLRDKYETPDSSIPSMRRPGLVNDIVKISDAELPRTHEGWLDLRAKMDIRGFFIHAVTHQDGTQEDIEIFHEIWRRPDGRISPVWHGFSRYSYNVYYFLT